MIPLWLEDYIKHLVDMYDLSFSEILRAEICCSILYSVSGIYPDYKSEFKLEDVFKKIRENSKNGWEPEELHATLSKVLFEARKAAEFRLSKEQKKKKKK